jgi:hypothetical protein
MLAAAVVMAEDGPRRPGIDELRAVASARRSQLNALQVDFVTHQEAPQGAPAFGQEIRWTSRRMLVDVPGGRYRMERSVGLTEDEEAELAHFAYDGEVESILLTQSQLGAVDETTSIKLREEARILALMMLNPPQPGGLGIDDGSLESLLEFGVLRDEVEEVNGRPCWVVDAVHEGIRYATIWLDLDRTLLPMKGVVLGQDGAEVSTFVATAVTALRSEAAEEIWFATRWDTEVEIAGYRVRTSVETDVESVVMNPPLNDSCFELHFPPGTTVADRVAGVVYRVPAPGEEVQFAVMDDLEAENGVKGGEFEAAHGAQEGVASTYTAPVFVPPPHAMDAGQLRPEPGALPAERTTVTLPGGPGPAAAEQAASAPPARGPALIPSRPSDSEPDVAAARDKRQPGNPDPLVRDVLLPRRVRGTSAPSLRLWVGLGAVAVVAMLTVYVRVAWRKRSRWSWGVLVGTTAFGIALLWPGTPVPRTSAPEGRSDSRSTRGADLSSDPADRYCLNEGEVIRYIAEPRDSDRAWLRQQFGLEGAGPIVSVTVWWRDGSASRGNLQIGEPVLPRALYAVLCDSLGLPPYLFVDLAVAHHIYLPGDWVVRRNLESGEYIRRIGECVRLSGYPGFAFVPVERDLVVYTARGEPRTAAQVFQIFAPRDGLTPSPPHSGTVDRFLRVVSRAIGRPITNGLSSNGRVRVSWEDNSPMYLDSPTGVTEEMISRVLDRIASDLDIRFEESREQVLVWRLCDQ